MTLCWSEVSICSGMKARIRRCCKKGNKSPSLDDQYSNEARFNQCRHNILRKITSLIYLVRVKFYSWFKFKSFKLLPWRITHEKDSRMVTKREAIDFRKTDWSFVSMELFAIKPWVSYRTKGIRRCVVLNNTLMTISALASIALARYLYPLLYVRVDTMILPRQSMNQSH
jgi:hypothetical protein